MADKTKRRLAAIVALDVVGFSRLMGVDEVGTLNRLKQLRKDLVQPSITGQGGRIVKLMGDGLLAEFPSAVQSVQCAVDIQLSMMDRELDVPEDQSIKLRIGINLGDIVVEGSDIYGDGVNIAARLEGIADPGGIYVSGKIHEEVRNRLDIAFKDLGDREVKNIEQPIRVWQWMNDASDKTPINSRAIGKLSLSGKPTIAVLPFDNMSGDPDQNYFADGISEDITTELSRFSSINVVSRHSAFKYRGSGLDLSTVGQELGAQYLLEGSVRRGGNRIRINVQLIDLESGNHVWAERYDRSPDDIFTIQDEITETVSSTVADQVQMNSTDIAKRKRPESLEAYDYLLRGLDLYKGGYSDKATAERAVAMFDKAIELDNSLARAYAWRACSATGLWEPPYSEDQIEESLYFVESALSLDDGECEAHRIMGAIYKGSGDFDRGEKHIRKALSLNPNDANIAAKASSFFSVYGNPDEALTLIQRAMALNPHHPDWYWTELGLALHTDGQYSSTIEALLHCVTPTFMDLSLLASSYAQTDRGAEAQECVRQLLKVQPDATLSKFQETNGYRREQDSRRFINGLEMAGLPRN
jgi:adenylate cyclase